MAVAVNSDLILSMAGSFQKRDCLLVTPLPLFVQREVVTGKAHAQSSSIVRYSRDALTSSQTVENERRIGRPRGLKRGKIA